jgi:predicted TIM-barrel fold metal-dependent hydrolase
VNRYGRYGGPVVDCHHHVWRPRDLPWLAEGNVPRIFGPHEPIRRDYLIDEYVQDAKSAGIVESVYVQTNWPMDRAVDEVRWLAEIHRESGWPSAVVGSADLFSPDAMSVLREQAAISPLVRGTRLQLHWHPREEFRFAAAPDALLDPVLVRNIGRLAELGWLFELQVFADQMPVAAELVAACPDTTFVLVHAGMLVDAGDEDEVARWTSGMRALAAQPNVVVKLTGQGTFVHRVDPGLIRFVAEHVLAVFGPRRAMFGSNFPVEKLWTAMPPLVDAWRDALSSRSPEEQQWIFADNARRVYGLSA